MTAPLQVTDLGDNLRLLVLRAPAQEAQRLQVPHEQQGLGQLRQRCPDACFQLLYIQVLL